VLSQVNEALIKALAKGTSFGAPSLNENLLAQVYFNTHTFTHYETGIGTGIEARNTGKTFCGECS